MKTLEKAIAIATLPHVPFEIKLLLHCSHLCADEILMLTWKRLEEIVPIRVSPLWSIGNAKREFDQFCSHLVHHPEIRVTTYDQKTYPHLLRTLDSPPYLLTYEGTIGQSQRSCITIIGTKNPTEGGKKASFSCAREASCNQLVVVSGLTGGIDMSAHMGALYCRGPTWAILDTGLGNLSNAQRNLKEMIVDHKGAIMSEIFPHAHSSTIHHEQRNRILASLSYVVIVIQAQLQSHTLSIVQEALDQGREVYVHTCGVHDHRFLGSNRLYHDGSQVITSFSDIQHHYV